MEFESESPAAGGEHSRGARGDRARLDGRGETRRTQRTARRARPLLAGGDCTMPWNLKDRDGEDVTDREGFGGIAGAAAGYGLGIALIPASAGLLGLGAVCGALTVNQ